MSETDATLKPLVLGIGVVILNPIINVGLRWNLDPEDDWWEDARQATLPVLDSYAERYGEYTTYPLAPEEYAGTAPMPPEEFEQRLAAERFKRNPIAALKTNPASEQEVGSWAYRDGPLARRQLHVMLFERETDNGLQTDVYAHEEYSSLHPLVAYEHYTAVDYDPEAGVERTRSIFDLKQKGPADGSG